MCALCCMSLQDFKHCFPIFTRMYFMMFHSNLIHNDNNERLKKIQHWFIPVETKCFIFPKFVFQLARNRRVLVKDLGKPPVTIYSEGGGGKVHCFCSQEAW